jgi:hypothetical protein
MTPREPSLVSNDRRDMTQGQRAIVGAMANTFTNCKFGDLGQLARALKVPLPRVSEAIIITKHAPDLAEQVKPMTARAVRCRTALARGIDSAGSSPEGRADLRTRRGLSHRAQQSHTAASDAGSGGRPVIAFD